MREWTAEEVERIIFYGRCEVCGEPRTVYKETFTNGKDTVVKTGITCPNGHTGWLDKDT